MAKVKGKADRDGTRTHNLSLNPSSRRTTRYHCATRPWTHLIENSGLLMGFLPAHCSASPTMDPSQFFHFYSALFNTTGPLKPPYASESPTNRKPHTMVHRVWCSGNIVDSQLFQQLTALSTAPGSTPGIRVTLFHFFFLPISFPCLPSLSNFMFQELL
jgi:hypothetical protein